MIPLKTEDLPGLPAYAIRSGHRGSRDNPRQIIRGLHRRRTPGLSDGVVIQEPLHSFFVGGGKSVR